MSSDKQNDKQPEVIVFAGPNGSGKSMITKLAKILEPYINADDIKKANPAINVAGVKERVLSGGHGVPDDKIRIRYKRALKLIPKLVEVCDIMHIYDNSVQPVRIFKKRKQDFFFWENDIWKKEQIELLTGVKDGEKK